MGEPNRIAGHVFISYVHEDSPRVDHLQRALDATGIPVWRDTQRLWPGEDWRAVIRRAITNDALAFIACYSQASIRRDKSYQNAELALAVEQLMLRRPDVPWLIPVRLDDCEIPDLDLGGGRTLNSIQRIDLFGDETGANTARLVSAVLRILGPPGNGHDREREAGARSDEATRFGLSVLPATRDGTTTNAPASPGDEDATGRAPSRPHGKAALIAGLAAVAVTAATIIALVAPGGPRGTPPSTTDTCPGHRIAFQSLWNPRLYITDSGGYTTYLTEHPTNFCQVGVGYAQDGTNLCLTENTNTGQVGFAVCGTEPGQQWIYNSTTHTLQQTRLLLPGVAIPYNCSRRDHNEIYTIIPSDINSVPRACPRWRLVTRS